jgi:hypothetical protein
MGTWSPSRGGARGIIYKGGRYMKKILDKIIQIIIIIGIIGACGLLWYLDRVRFIF